MAEQVRLVMFSKDGMDAVEAEKCLDEEWRVTALALIARWTEVITLDDGAEFVATQGLDSSPFSDDASAEEAEMFFTIGTVGQQADFAILPLHSIPHELDEPAIIEAYMEARLGRAEVEFDEHAMNKTVAEVLALRPCVVLVALRADGEDVGDDEYNLLYGLASTLGNAVLLNGLRFEVREEKVEAALARAELTNEVAI